MKKDRSFTEGAKLTAVRLPNALKSAAETKAKEEDLTFSQLMRRALRRELGESGGTK